LSASMMMLIFNTEFSWLSNFWSYSRADQFSVCRPLT
jgi:hypothetical protein